VQTADPSEDRRKSAATFAIIELPTAGHKTQYIFLPNYLINSDPFAIINKTYKVWGHSGAKQCHTKEISNTAKSKKVNLK